MSPGGRARVTRVVRPLGPALIAATRAIRHKRRLKTIGSIRKVER